MIKLLSLEDQIEHLEDEYRLRISSELNSGEMSEEDIRNLYDVDSISYAVYESRFIIDKMTNPETEEETEMYFIKSDVEKANIRSRVNIQNELSLYLDGPSDVTAFMNSVKGFNVVGEDGKYNVDRMLEVLSYSNNYKNNREKAKLLEDDIVKYLVTDRLLSKKSYRMVSLYNNNGESVEEYSNNMPKNLIGFSYIDDGDIDTSNENYNIAINALLGGAPGIAKHLSGYSSGVVKTFFEKIAAHLSIIDDHLKDLTYTYSASEIASFISKERGIIDNDILEFGKNGNLDGVSVQEEELINTLSFIVSALAIAIPTGTAAVSIMAVGAAVGGGISYFTNQLKNSMSEKNGIFEFNRYKELISSEDGLNIYPEFTNGKINGKINFGLHTVIANSLVQNKIEGSKEDDYIKAISGDNNELKGEGGNDRLIGSKNRDTLLGGSGKDQLTGGRGTDTLNGGADDDTYIYYNGDGHDTIKDYSIKIHHRSGGEEIEEMINEGTDTLILKDYKRSDVIIERNYNDETKTDDLLLKFNNNYDDEIRIMNYYHDNFQNDSAIIETSNLQMSHKQLLLRNL